MGYDLVRWVFMSIHMPFIHLIMYYMIIGLQSLFLSGQRFCYDPFSHTYWFYKKQLDCVYSFEFHVDSPSLVYLCAVHTRCSAITSLSISFVNGGSRSTPYKLMYASAEAEVF